MDARARILVINVTRIGDTLFTTPALRALAETWPEAKITVLAHPNRAEVLEHLPFLHRVGPIEKRRAPFLGRLPGKPYDLALVYGHDRALVEYALRVARRVVAFRQGDAQLDARLWRAVEEPAPYSEHAILTTLRLPGALGMAPGSRRIAYRVASQERRAAADLLRRSGLDGARPLIGLQSSSFPTKAYRDWPLGHFAALAAAVRETWPDAGFLIFGGPDDKARTTQLRQMIGPGSLDLAGWPLRTNAALMERLDAYIGVDTGPTHIMSSFDIPMIGLYHCLLPHALYGPLDHPMDFGIDHPRLGQPCDETTAMSEITVATVFSRLREALDRRLENTRQPA